MALPLWIISFGLAGFAVREARQFAHLEAVAVSHLTAYQIDAWYFNAVEDLQILARNRAFDQGPTPESWHVLRDAASVRPDWLAIGWVDVKGRLRQATGFPPSRELFDVGAFYDVQQALTRNRSAMSGRFRLRHSSREAIAISVPVERNSRPIGLLRVVIALEQVQRSFDQMLAQSETHGLISRPRDLQLAVNDDLGMPVLRPASWPRLPIDATGASGVMPTRSGSSLLKASDGVEWLIGYTIAPLTGWRVAVGFPAQDFPGYQGGWVTPVVALNLVATLATLLLGIWLARKSTRPIVELGALAARFGSGELAVRSPHLEGELGVLAEAFNQMASRIETSHHELEHQVKERTAALETANADLQSSAAQMAITNRHLEATVEELRVLDRQRSDFINMISHDLRIPLTAISGYGEFLDEGLGGELNAEQREYVTRLLESVQRMVVLLDQLLELARSDAGRLKLHLQMVDLSELVHGTLGPLEVLADRKKQQLQVEASPALPPVILDPDRIQQVISNLVSNAIKYTPEGGHIQVRLSQSGGTLRVEVTDDGPGIAPEDQPHMFERFFRSARVRHIPGTGLGLAIAKTIVEAHGGQIGLSSTPGAGSTFWFELPEAPPAELRSRHDPEESRRGAV